MLYFNMLFFCCSRIKDTILANCSRGCKLIWRVFLSNRVDSIRQRTFFTRDCALKSNVFNWKTCCYINLSTFILISYQESIMCSITYDTHDHEWLINRSPVCIGNATSYKIQGTLAVKKNGHDSKWSRSRVKSPLYSMHKSIAG